MNRRDIYRKVEREIEYDKPHTQSQYRAQIGEYLEFVGDGSWKDEDTLYRYTRRLKRCHYAQASITWILNGPILTLFKAYGIERLPIKMPKFQGISMDISDRIAFGHDEVVALIKAARASNNPQWLAYMALSSIWLLRAGEIRQFRSQDIKKHKGFQSIKVYTLKRGRTTEHMIPPEVATFITNYDFPALSDNEVFRVFDQIRLVAGLPHLARKSWHAIRHAVINGLILNKGDVSELVIYGFCRWQVPGMLGIYFKPQSFDDDKKIYPIHPFLQYWK